MNRLNIWHWDKFSKILAALIFSSFFSYGFAEQKNDSILASSYQKTLENQWVNYFKSPRCYAEIITAANTGTNNALFINDSGIGDILTHRFVRLTLVSAWTSRGTTTKSSSDAPYNDNGYYGSHYLAFEFYPIDGPFQVIDFYDKHEYLGSGQKSVPINTILIFQDERQYEIPVAGSNALTILFYQNKLPEKPTRSTSPLPSGGYMTVPITYAYSQSPMCPKTF